MSSVLSPGSEIDRYVIEAPLGEGGMGSVYRAFDTRLRRRVALKVIRGGQGEITRESAARMLREARVAAALSHPNVVTIFDVGESGGVPFLAQELLTGATLRHAMEREEAGLDQRLRWLLEVADALAAAHRIGLVHRDVKPENIMIVQGGAAKVLDFGLARAVDDVREPAGKNDLAPSSFRTAGSAIGGTPKYMAPEQLAGARVDERADQFAWGLVAFEVLARIHPRDARPDFSAAMGWSAPAPRLEQIATTVPDRVAGVVMRALGRDPTKRWPSMDSVVGALIDARPGLEAVRPKRTGAGPRTGPTAEASPEIAEAPTTKVELEARLGDVREPAAPPRTPPRRGLWLAAALALVAASSAAAIALRSRSAVEAGRPATHVRPATPRCALDTAGVVDLRPSFTFYGITPLDAGVLVAGRVGTPPNNSAQAGLLPGNGEPFVFSTLGPVENSTSYPIRAAEPMVAVYANYWGKGTLYVSSPKAPDQPVEVRAQATSRVRAGAVVAEAAAGTAFIAVDGLLPVDEDGGRKLVPAVQAFVYTPGENLAEAMVATRASLLDVAASPGRGAVLCANTSGSLSVTFIDRHAKLSTTGVVSANEIGEAGTLTFRDSALVVIWDTPARNGRPEHWRTTSFAESGQPLQSEDDVPGSENATTPFLVSAEGRIEAVWAVRGPSGSELRYSSARDAMDLPRASMSVLTTSEPIAVPKIAVRGSTRWVAWTEGVLGSPSARTKVAPLRCE